MPRNSDTSAATLSNRMRKWRRWAAEMRAAGWIVIEPQPEPAQPATTETEEN